MDNVKVINGQWHVKCGKTYTMRSNFIFRILYDSLKASKEDLPFPPPLNTMWRDIQKIIDRLHLQNHKQDKCKELYNPDKVLPEGYNTMVAEQTFAWFSRFKKIANSMSQTHHLFYIHRNIKRRNAYSSRCRQRGKEPLLPGINTNLSKN